jgi:hypothetical protein
VPKHGLLRTRGGAPILSRPSVETMTTDQLTPGQKAVPGFFPGDFDARGWGFWHYRGSRSWRVTSWSLAAQRW